MAGGFLSPGAGAGVSKVCSVSDSLFSQSENPEGEQEPSGTFWNPQKVLETGIQRGREAGSLCPRSFKLGLRKMWRN